MQLRDTRRRIFLASALWAVLACASVAVPATTEDDAPAADPGISNAIRWQTATEIENFGFDVYRGDREEGPFVRLTEAPIPGAGTSDVPTRYQYVDTTIAPDTAYYYYVESISTSGVRERFTPVFKSKPKALAGQDEDAE